MTPRRKLLILPAGILGSFAEEIDLGDDLAGFAGAFIVRTLAISQLVPTIILTWLPTWPDKATDGSECDWKLASAAESRRTCDPEPAISTTWPIGASLAAGLAGDAGRVLPPR